MAQKHQKVKDHAGKIKGVSKEKVGGLTNNERMRREGKEEKEHKGKPKKGDLLFKKDKS
ncbi:hypothetical protein [Alkalicoccus saliphilus]|uniref:hypothetical protein n=1 Tax=Alkalicoccus saliphilus TaxID=200989 RepID=UPI0014732336|nr:hypothetical protein [Alkalicoccus saliphilus]